MLPAEHEAHRREKNIGALISFLTKADLEKQRLKPDCRGNVCDMAKAIS